MSSVSVHRIQPVFSDDRGTIADLLNADEEIHHIGLITFTTGAVRANHYHERSKQHDYVLSGKIELRTKPANDPSAIVSTTILEAGDAVSIPEFVIHAYKALEPSIIIDMTTMSRDAGGYEKDTIRVASLF